MYSSGNIFTIFIVIMLIRALFSGIDITSTLLMLPGLVLGLTIHEFAHAKMSDKLGDPTPERQGRLTLNPLAHMDPMGTICLLFAGFGWGKPVVIDSTYYRNPAKDNMKVALAGPVSNFILAFILFLVEALIYAFIPNSDIINLLRFVIKQGAYINLSLGVFNLLPFPPLDGSKIWGYFLKGKAKAIMWNLEKYSTIILIILFATKLPAYIISPVVDAISTGMEYLITQLMFIIT